MPTDLGRHSMRHEDQKNRTKGCFWSSQDGPESTMIGKGQEKRLLSLMGKIFF